MPPAETHAEIQLAEGDWGWPADEQKDPVVRLRSPQK